MKCYAPDGTEYMHQQWETCLALWQKAGRQVLFSMQEDWTRTGWYCTIAGRISCGATIRAAFCNATTAWHKAQVKP